MARRRQAEVRVIQPDLVYQDVLVSATINRIMKDGKKNLASRIFYGACRLVQARELSGDRQQVRDVTDVACEKRLDGLPQMGELVGSGRTGLQESGNHPEQADAGQCPGPRRTVGVGGASQGDERQHPDQEARPKQRELELVGRGKARCMVERKQK